MQSIVSGQGGRPSFIAVASRGRPINEVVAELTAAGEDG
jgi:hypothetical protein